MMFTVNGNRKLSLRFDQKKGDNCVIPYMENILYAEILCRNVTEKTTTFVWFLFEYDM